LGSGCGAIASSRVLWSFAVEQIALAFNAPGIAKERAIVANDTMAGNGDGKMVRGASSCHGTGRSRRADAPRDLSIGQRGADRNLLERLPHASLESSAVNIKGKVEPDPRRAALISGAWRTSKSYSFTCSNTVAWAMMSPPLGLHTPLFAFKFDCAAAGDQGRFADDNGGGTGGSEFDTGVRTGVHARPEQATHAKVIGSTR
jgi:hypothetical protein